MKVSSVGKFVGAFVRGKVSMDSMLGCRPLDGEFVGAFVRGKVKMDSMLGCRPLESKISSVVKCVGAFVRGYTNSMVD